MATTLENLEQYAALADLEEAMSAVAQDMSEPWEWNRWQSAASALLPYFADAPRDQSAWSLMRRRQMEERFGPNWTEQLRRARAARARGVPIAAAGGLRPRDVGASAPPAAVPPKSAAPQALPPGPVRRGAMPPTTTVGVPPAAVEAGPRTPVRVREPTAAGIEETVC